MQRFLVTLLVARWTLPIPTSATRRHHDTSIVDILTLENRNGSWRIELLRTGFWGRGTVPGCGLTASLMLCVSTYTYI